MRLGRRVRVERSRRWPTRLDFAEESGLSDRVLGAIETAERANFSAKTIERLESALGWEFGSAARVRGGLEPLYVEDPNLRRLRDAWPHLSADSRRMLADIAERAARE